MPEYKHTRSSPAQAPPNWSITRVSGSWEQGEGSVILPGEVVKIPYDLGEDSGFERYTAPKKRKATRKKAVVVEEPKEEEKEAEQEDLLED